MLKFNARDYNEFQQEFDERSIEISILALKSICKAIDENADAVSLGFLVNMNIDIIVKREGYLNALERNIDRAAEAEEFELCAKAAEYIKMLKSKNEKEV
jgi:hypothetical protein